MALTVHQHPVRALGPDGPFPAFGITVAPGVCGGVFTIYAPSLVNTSSNAAANLPSRCRIRSRNEPIRSARCITRLRARWAVHAEDYLLVPRITSSTVKVPAEASIVVVPVAAAPRLLLEEVTFRQLDRS